MSIRNFNSVDWKEIKILKALILSFLAALEALVNVKVTPETFWQALYMETTRSIVWLAKKKKARPKLLQLMSETEPLGQDHWEWQKPKTLELPLTGSSLCQAGTGLLPRLYILEGWEKNNFLTDRANSIHNMQELQNKGI